MKRIRDMTPDDRKEHDKKKKEYREVGFVWRHCFFFQSLSFTGHSFTLLFLFFFIRFLFRPQKFFSDPKHRDEKNRAARAAHATPAGAATKLDYKKSAHSNVDVVLPNSCAGNHVRKFSSTAPKSAARAAEMTAVRTVAKHVMSAFKFGTDMCRVMRTVLVDPARSGPLAAPAVTWTGATWKWALPPPPPTTTLKLARIFFFAYFFSFSPAPLRPGLHRRWQPAGRQRPPQLAARHAQAFSTHIVTGEFDPTGDVLSQLQALDDRQPHPSLPY
jgi:hypothetical protein